MATVVEPAVDRMEIRPLSIEEYHWLIEHGFFHEDEHVELIRGVLHQMSPEGPRHVAAIDRLLNHFFETLRDRTQVRVQHPISLPDSNSEPEPDLVLAQKRDDCYSDRHPAPADVFLVVEVAASSLEEDRSVKVPLYAAAGIAECWIVNLRDDRIEVYREPVVPAAGAPYYHQHLRYSAEDSLHPAQFPDCVLAVAELVPPKRA